jgi:hypothetical protein
MAKGGKTNAMMKQYGRGMAKVMNQRNSTKVPKGSAATKKGG